METQQPALPSEPIIPPATHKPEVKNSLVLIMSVLLIVTVAITGFFYFQIQKLSKQLSQYQASISPTPTASQAPAGDLANWETYKYDTFSIKLPPEWYATQLKNPIQFLNYVPTTPGGDFNPLIDSGKLKIEIYKNKSPLSLKEYVSERESGPLEPKDYSETPTKINDLEAIKTTSSNLGFSYFVKNGDYIFHLVFILDFNNYTDLADQILSTFKFTEP